MRELIFRLRKNDTGEERDYRDTYPDDYLDEGIEYLWNEGNYACDCNRELFWCRLEGKDDPNSPCSDDRFDVVSVTENGKPFPLEIW